MSTMDGRRGPWHHLGMPHDADPFPAIDTPRLRLRCARAADAPRIAGLMTPAISRWLASWPTPYTPAMAGERIAAWGAMARDGHGMPCVVEERSGGVVVGWVHVLRLRERPERATMGYWSGEAYGGRGYVREAAAALAAAAWGFLGVEVSEAGAQPGNAGSFAVMRALGMRPAGERMVFASARGREELCLFYEMTRDPGQVGATCRGAE